MLFLLVLCMLLIAALIREFILDPWKSAQAQVPGIFIEKRASHLEVRWEKLPGYRHNRISIRIPLEFKPRATKVRHVINFELRFDHIQAWTTPPPFPVDMALDVSQGFVKREHAEAWRERQRRWKLIEAEPATRFLKERERFIELMRGMWIDVEDEKWHQRPPWWGGSDLNRSQIDGSLGGLIRFSRRHCFKPHQIQTRPELEKLLRAKGEAGELLPGNCFLDRFDTTYVSPPGTPVERWTFVVCNSRVRNCRAHFMASGLLVNMWIWEADVQFLENYTEPVRALAKELVVGSLDPAIAGSSPSK